MAPMVVAGRAVVRVVADWPARVVEVRLGRLVLARARRARNDAIPAETVQIDKKIRSHRSQWRPQRRAHTFWGAVHTQMGPVHKCPTQKQGYRSGCSQLFTTELATAI
jgi:hypothetical protein